MSPNIRTAEYIEMTTKYKHFVITVMKERFIMKLRAE
jgi:hypothetical protein